MVAEHSQNKGRLFTQKQGTMPFRAAIQKKTVWHMLRICKDSVGWYYDLQCTIPVLAFGTNTNFKQLFFHDLFVTTKKWIKLIYSNYTLWVVGVSHILDIFRNNNF